MGNARRNKFDPRRQPVSPSSRSFNTSIQASSGASSTIRNTPDPLVQPARNRAEFSLLIQGSFFQTAQYFRDAPGLGDAAARCERRLGVEDFADRADAGFGEMRLETVEEMPRCRAIVGVNLEPSIDERADQPGPHRPLVVCRIAGAQVAEIARLVIGLARR